MRYSSSRLAVVFLVALGVLGAPATRAQDAGPRVFPSSEAAADALVRAAEAHDVDTLVALVGACGTGASTPGPRGGDGAIDPSPTTPFGDPGPSLADSMVVPPDEPPPQSCPDLTGTWKLEVKLDAGTGTPTFVLKQQGKEITGTYQGYFGKADVAGTVEGDQFEFSFSIQTGQLGPLQREVHLRQYHRRHL